MKTIPNLLVLLISIILLNACKKDEKQIINGNTINNYLDYPDFVKDGLIVYYPFNANADNYVGSMLHGTVHSVTYSADRFGRPDRACLFDGKDSYIEIPGSGLLNNQAYTICFWYRTDVANENDTIRRSVISKADSSRNGFTIDLAVHDHINSMGFTYKDDHIESWSEFGPNLREWTPEFKVYEFAAVAFNDTSIFDYLGGNTEIHKPASYFNNNTYILYIGRSNNSKYNYFKGEIDDLLIYNRILSENEIQKLYDLGIK